MIYFVVAQTERDGQWTLSGPWEYIEEADEKIVELNKIKTKFGNPVFSQIEIARVLTEEDGPDWSDSVHDI